jgi:predicted ATPase/DNA-binding CsgD family transcriptional regulator
MVLQPNCYSHMRAQPLFLWGRAGLGWHGGEADLVDSARHVRTRRRLGDHGRRGPPSPGVEAPPTPLPYQPTSLFGRDAALTAAHALLDRPDVRLVTVTGPGGTGKTRLALALAARLGDRFADGAVFVDLAPITAPTLVLSAIARALRLKEAPDQPLLDRLIGHLRDAELLLVLDNFEQLVPASPLLAELLAACPGLRMVVTSRQALRLRWEHVFPLAPLDPDAALDLFVDRARAADPLFELAPDDAEVVAELCRRLDGLPLAIELAAAHANLLTPASMLERFDPSRALDFLGAGPPDQPTRQRTLRAAVAWSHDLLGGDERALFRRLAVFRGGFTLEAAGHVGGASDEPRGDALSLLSALVDKSLLRPVVGASGTATRFTMLETIRAYAREQLDESGEAPLLASRHAEYFLSVAEQAETALRGPQQTAWLARLDAELPNLRAALDWAERSGAVELGLRLAGALWKFWEVHGHLREGGDRLSRFLSHPDAEHHPAARAAALRGAAHLAFLRADYDLARNLHEDDHHLRSDAGDRAGVAAALSGLGLVEMCCSRFEAARALVAEAAELQRALGDELSEAAALNNLGRVAYYEGDFDGALPLHERSAQIRRRLGDDWGLALAQADLADVLVERGELDAAREALDASAALWRKQANRWGLAYVLEGLAGVAAARGRVEDAFSLLASASRLRDAIGEPASPVRAGAVRRVLNRALERASLTRDQRAAAWARGEALSVDDALHLLDASPPAPPVPARTALPSPVVASHHPSAVVPLSPREIEVARLVSQGLTNRQLSAQLIISERTADAHLAKILKKLGFSSRAQVAAWVAQHGLA